MDILFMETIGINIGFPLLSLKFMCMISPEEKSKENQEKTKRKSKECARPVPPPEGAGQKRGRLPKTAQRIDKWSTLLRGWRKGRQPLPVPSAAAACTPPRSGCRPLSPKNPIGEVWRAEALQLPSEPGDMRGGFGSLAQQGFPARFPGRAPGAWETCPGEKGRQRRPFSTS